MIKDIVQISKATAAAVVAALVYSLLFAAVVTLFGLPSSVLMPVNQVFKIVCIALGGLLFIRGERGLFKGAVFGISAVVQTWLLFSTIACSFEIGWGLVLECVIGAFAGGITGIIAVNVKKA